MKKTFIVLLTLFASGAFAQGNSYQAQIDSFFSLLEAGKLTDAVQEIYSTNPWMKNKTEDIKQVSQRLDKFSQVIGDYCGAEHLVETKIKDRFVYVVYLALYERQPLRMNFAFYRP